MTPAAKLTYLAALLIGLSVGLLYGYRNGAGLLEGFGEARLITAPSTLSDFSREEYVHAGLEHAETALLTYATLLEQLEKMKPEKGRKYELSVTYVRLALLEDDRDLRQSREFMTKARYWNTASGGQDISDSEMKAALTRFDHQLGLARSLTSSR